ncbi:MAG: hypothetical protein WD533_00445 [Dehalococcoidia bacterium]
MVTNDFTMLVNQHVSELLRTQDHDQLESYRFHGSLNLVYHVPIPDTDRFVVVKVLPPRTTDWKRKLKRPMRNLLYGEKIANTGRQRAAMEVERYREWRRAGLPTPDLIESTIPGVRIIEGLPYPTFYSILGEMDLGTERKLSVLGHISRSLAAQHEKARALNKHGLVHQDPGPWNVLFDLDSDRTYWFDLEHPAQQPGMTVEDLCIRATRVFTFGVLDHLSAHFDEAMGIIVESYGRRETLFALARNLERSAVSVPMRVANRLGFQKERRAQQERIAAALRAQLR